MPRLSPRASAKARPRQMLAQTYGDRIAVGVDARDGYVAVSGWKELSAEKGVDFCRRLRDAGVQLSLIHI